jgi:hypothetical protein
MDERRRSKSEISTRARIALILVFAVTALASGGPVLAAKPTAGAGGTDMNDPGILRLTPEQRAALPAKLATLENVTAGARRASGQLAAMTIGDPPSIATLPTYARHQRRWFYCGPATVQVVSNESWHIYSTDPSGQNTATNKYTQSFISATWTKTDVNLQTNLGDLIIGLNGATRRPSGWAYVQLHNPTWDTFHNAIISDIWAYGMALAAHVNPRKANSQQYLSSWANVSPGDYGHYIPLRGYAGFSSSTAVVFYNDSSGGRDEVTGIGILGATGAFSDASTTVYQTMMNRYGNLVW